MSRYFKGAKLVDDDDEKEKRALDKKEL